MEEDAVSGPGKLVPKPARAPGIKWRNTESAAPAGLHRRATAVTAPAPGQGAPVTSYDASRHRLRAQRPGRGQPPRRRRLVGARPRGPARPRRRRTQRQRAPPRLRARHLQRVLPARRRLSDDQVVPPRGPRPGLDATPPPCSATRCPTASGRCWTATASSLPRWFEDQQPGDGEAWLDAVPATGTSIGEHLIAGLLTPVPARARRARRPAASCRRAGGLQFVRTLLTPALDLGRNRFRGEAPRVLLAGNAGHADIPLDAPGSGLMALLMSMMGQTVGFPVPEGGAGELTQALARRLRVAGRRDPLLHPGRAHRHLRRPGPHRAHRRRRDVRGQAGRRGDRRRARACTTTCSLRPTSPTGSAAA